jgi:hypothetical protein
LLSPAGMLLESFRLPVFSSPPELLRLIAPASRPFWLDFFFGGGKALLADGVVLDEVAVAGTEPEVEARGGDNAAVGLTGKADLVLTAL